MRLLCPEWLSGTEAVAAADASERGHICEQNYSVTDLLTLRTSTRSAARWVWGWGVVTRNL